MKSLLYVALGGALGSSARYALALAMGARLGAFPVATLSINVLGCLLAGFVASRSTSEPLRLFLVVGLLGGFTTFSAFGLETVTLMKRGQAGLAALYVLLSVAGGLAGAYIGLRGGR